MLRSTSARLSAELTLSPASAGGERKSGCLENGLGGVGVLPVHVGGDGVVRHLGDGCRVAHARAPGGMRTYLPLRALEPRLPFPDGVVMGGMLKFWMELLGSKLVSSSP